jgi:hypothetical protein
MGQELRRGFKADAERLALAIREEIGLRPIDPVDCEVLCGKLAIPTITISRLAVSGASPKSIHCLLSNKSNFSAMTVGFGTKRLIVYNPRHPAGRRANSLAHELSHILLEHPLSPALGDGGCRRWNPVLEAEADWQAAALLVPRIAALSWMRSGGSVGEGALHFGVSVSLFQWRMNQTGVARQLAASGRI